MKPTVARGYIRQLCCLGLSAQAVIPELLRAVSALIPSGPNVFVGAAADYALDPALVILEGPIPALADPAAQESCEAFRPTIEVHTEFWRHSSAPVTRYPGAIDCDILHCVVGQERRHPPGRHQGLEGLVSEQGRPLGYVYLYRTSGDRPFSEREARELARLLPYMAHSLHVHPEQSDAFIDSGYNGHLIFDRAGRLTHQSDTAKRLLSLAAHAQPDSSQPSLTLLLGKIIRALTTLTCGREAPPPMCCWQNPWGQFVFRAYQLNDTVTGQSGFTLIAIEHQERFSLRLMRGLSMLPLSIKEREVCLGLARNQPQIEIAKRLGIKPNTVKKYIDAVYLKLGIHNRSQLLQQILSQAERLQR